MGGAAYDPVTQRIYVSQYQAFGDSHVIHVYEIINLTPSSHAPVLAPVGNRSIAAGQQIQLTVQGSDADDDTLQYSATGE